MAYIRSLAKKYDLKACYVLNDNGYSEKIVDIIEIQNMGILVIKFVPNAPYLHTYYDSVEIHEDGSGVVHSSKTCLRGMHSCFTQYLNHLPKENSKDFIIKPASVDINK